MNRDRFMSRREAAQRLGVAYPTTDKLLAKNGIKPQRLPNHSRVWYPRNEVMTLVSAFETKLKNN